MMEDYNKALDHLQFSPEDKDRIARKLNAAASDKRPQRMMRRRRALSLAAAATFLALVVGCTAYAASSFSRVEKPAGPEVSPTEVVNGIGRPLVHASSNGVTVTAEAVFGGASDYAVVFSIAKDDGTAFEGIEPLEDGTLPLEFGGVGNLYMDDARSIDWMDYFYDADPSDHAIQYVRKISLEALDKDRDPFVGRTVKVRFLNLLARDTDGTARTLVEGSWKMEFAANYTDQSKTAPGGQTVELGRDGATVESVTLSPVGLSVELTSKKDFSNTRLFMLIDMIRATLGTSDADSSLVSDQATELQEDLQNMKLGLNMKNGSFVETPCLRGGAITVQDGVATCSVHVFPTSFVDLDDVASATVGGVVIPFTQQ